MESLKFINLIVEVSRYEFPWHAVDEGTLFMDRDIIHGYGHYSLSFNNAL